MDALDFLNHRRSTPARHLGEPGPDPEQLRRIVGAALRVPDHGRLAPFRLLGLQGQARQRLGDFLAERARQRDPELPVAALDKERNRMSQAPLVLAVIARIQATPKVPRDEQLLSAGCVCFALLQAAQALGFGAQWLTGWPASDAAVAHHLGLDEHETLIGFIHIGSVREPAAERPRPELDRHFAFWTG